MNAIQKERSKKLRGEVKNDLKVFKLQAEIRRNNEHHLEQELDLQKSLSDFHKPVTEQLQQQELSRKEHFKTITDAIANIPLAIENIPPAIEHPPAEIYNFDNELDVEFLDKNNFPRPSKLYYEPKDTLREVIARVNNTYIKMARQKGNVMSQLARMTRKDEEREDALLSKADYLREHMLTLDDYRGRLSDLQRKEIYILIAKLKSAYRKGEEVSLQIDKTKTPNYDMHLTPTQITQIGKGKRITISKTQLKKTGGFLPFLAPFLPALIAGAKALALGAASGAAGWGAKKALDKISGSGYKKIPLEREFIKIGNIRRNSKTAEKSEDFTIEYARPFSFKQIALQSFSMYVSWENIKDEQFSYYDGSQWLNLSIPDGNYTIKGLNRYMVKFFGNDPPILFGIIEERQRTAIKLKDQYKIDLTKTKNLHKLLGFEPKVYAEPEQIGKYIADLSGGNDNIYIHCDIIEGAYINGFNSSDVIYSFTNSNRPGSQIIKSFDKPLFFPVRMDSVYRIRMRITNHRNELIPLNKQEVQYNFITL
ncbi:uncharacterized protein TNCV_2252591 [Trichonephila clavipes]|nr:uncharacterized protein TNCV_2252591 [Trichonephila clavipes]